MIAKLMLLKKVKFKLRIPVFRWNFMAKRIQKFFLLKRERDFFEKTIIAAQFKLRYAQTLSKPNMKLPNLEALKFMISTFTQYWPGFRFLHAPDDVEDTDMRDNEIRSIFELFEAKVKVFEKIRDCEGKHILELLGMKTGLGGDSGVPLDRFWQTVYYAVLGCFLPQGKHGKISFIFNRSKCERFQSLQFSSYPISSPNSNLLNLAFTEIFLDLLFYAANFQSPRLSQLSFLPNSTIILHLNLNRTLLPQT